MFIKSQVELIYEGQGVEANGSPTVLEIKKTIKVDEAETFSANYYNNQQRNMRLSRNLVIPTHYCDDIVEDGVTYELMYVNYYGKKYKVRNILKARDYFGSGRGYTRRMMLLDIQEVR